MDAYTDELFALPPEQASTVRFPVSRLVVDPEGFEEDAGEVMAGRGFGVYLLISGQENLGTVSTQMIFHRCMIYKYCMPVKRNALKAAVSSPATDNDHV